MIISPTQDGMTTLTDPDLYYVRLPDVSINFVPPKTISTSKTIGGSATISVWEPEISGERREFDVTVDRATYDTMMLIHKSDVDEWLLRSQGRIFVCTVSLKEALPQRKNKNKWDLKIEIVIVDEETNG